MPLPFRAGAALGLAAAMLLPPAPASAALFHLDFTGVVTNSRDRGPTSLFGGPDLGGQIGQLVSGRISFDSAAYTDLNADARYGVYGPANGLFPQPLDRFASSFTLVGRTFLGSQHMGGPGQHSLEAAYVQDIPPLNFVQQDIYRISDGSQRLVCSNPAVPTTCTGGEAAISQLTLSLFGALDFVASDALAQPLSLDAAAIAAIVGAPGGGQASSYLMRSDGSDGGPAFWAEGEFRLTSLSLAPATVPLPAIPEPGTLPLLAAGLLALWFRRRRPGRGGAIA